MRPPVLARSVQCVGAELRSSFPETACCRLGGRCRAQSPWSSVGHRGIASLSRACFRSVRC